MTDIINTICNVFIVILLGDIAKSIRDYLNMEIPF